MGDINQNAAWKMLSPWTPDYSRCEKCGELKEYSTNNYSAYKSACQSLGDFLQKDMAQTANKFGDYKAKSPLKGVYDYAFEFRWTRKDPACKAWWTDPEWECGLWYNSFLENTTCTVGPPSHVKIPLICHRLGRALIHLEAIW